MKKKTIQLALSLAIAALAFSACSKEDNNKQEQGTEQAVRFSIMEEGFGADTEITRASAESLKPAITEFEDCEAESSVENEPAEQAATRAITTPTHYTVRIYKDGALKGEFKGIFSSSGFTPDAGTPIQIVLRRNSTYDVLCFNDDVTPVGDKLEVTLANAATARIGRQQITLGTTDDIISISAKHVGVRVRTQITAKKDIPSAITATLESKSSNIPQRVSYNPADGTYTTLSTAAMAATGNNSPASAEMKYSASNYGSTYSYTSTADYHYFLPTTDVASFKLNIAGATIFWKAINGSINKLANNSSLMVANGTYLIKVKMKPSYSYLMSNGSIGHFKDTTYGGGDKTPIALIVDDSQNMAIALNEIPAGTMWTVAKYDWLYTNTHTATSPETSLYEETTSGKEETWNASYSTASVTGNKVKGNNTDFPAIYATAHYNPGVTYSGSPALIWYMPTNGDFKQLLSLGFGSMSPRPYIRARWYGNLLNEALTQVAGTVLADGNWGKRHWTSTVCTQGGRNVVQIPSISRASLEFGMGTFIPSFTGNMNPIRPFVVYR